jgi:hypothetical protein
LIDYIPSLNKAGAKQTDIIMNVDLIILEAQKNKFRYESGLIGKSEDFEFNAIN